MKEDVDEDGNVKEGVLEEAGVPFDKRDGGGEKYGRAARGEEGEESSEEEEEKGKEGVVTTGGGDDDVD